MKYVLFEDSVIAKGLSLEKINELLTKANATKTTEYFVFRTTFKNGWELHARSKHVARAFLENPADFVIEG